MCIVKIDTAGFLSLLSQYFDSLSMDEILRLGYRLENRLNKEEDLPFGVAFHVKQIENHKYRGNQYESDEIEPQTALLFKTTLHDKVLIFNENAIDLRPLKNKWEEFVKLYKEILSQNGIKEPSELIAELEVIVDEVVKIK